MNQRKMLTHFSSVVNYFIIYTQSENPLHNHVKGIFILFCFIKKQKQMIFALTK